MPTKAKTCRRNSIFGAKFAEGRRCRGVAGKETFCNNRYQKVSVTFGTQTDGKTEIPRSLLTRNQDEADTLLVLHPLNASPHTELVGSSTDGQILMSCFKNMLVNRYPNLPISTIYLTGKGKKEECSGETNL